MLRADAQGLLLLRRDQWRALETYAEAQPAVARRPVLTTCLVQGKNIFKNRYWIILVEIYLFPAVWQTSKYIYSRCLQLHLEFILRPADRLPFYGSYIIKYIYSHPLDNIYSRKSVRISKNIILPYLLVEFSWG